MATGDDAMAGSDPDAGDATAATEAGNAAFEATVAMGEAGGVGDAAMDVGDTSTLAATDVAAGCTKPVEPGPRPTLANGPRQPGVSTSTGNTRYTPTVVRPCARPTPRIEPVRRTSQANTSPTTNVVLRSGTE